MQKDDLEETLDRLETEVLETLDNPYSTYSVKFPYTCSFSFPDDDHHTRITIETVSETVRFGRDEHDVSLQIDKDQALSRRTYAKHVHQWIGDRWFSIDPKDVEVTYGTSYSIEPMTDDEVEEWTQRCLYDD